MLGAGPSLVVLPQLGVPIPGLRTARLEFETRLVPMPLGGGVAPFESRSVRTAKQRERVDAIWHFGCVQRSEILMIATLASPLRRRSRAKVLVMLAAWTGVTLAALVVSARSQNADLADLRGRALELVNAERRERKLPDLRFESALNEAALQHARDMLSRTYYSHQSPEGETVHDRYFAAGGGKWRLVSENIAKCEDCDPPVDKKHVEQLQKGWMESPEHRQNILTEGLDRFGYGIVADQAGGLYAVQTFSGPGAPRGLASGKAATPIEPGEQQRIALEMINEQRSKVDAPPLEPGEALNGVLDAVHRGGLEPQASGDLFSHLPSEQRRDWRTLQVMYAQCGGCGVAATAADVRYFVSEMLEDGAQRSVLLDPKFTHLAFRVEADGEGRKDAALVLGARRGG